MDGNLCERHPTPVGCTGTSWQLAGSTWKTKPQVREYPISANIRPFDSTTFLGDSLQLLFAVFFLVRHHRTACNVWVPDVADMGCCSSSSSNSFCKGRIFKMSCRVVPHTWQTIGSPESGFSCGLLVFLRCSCPFLGRF